MRRTPMCSQDFPEQYVRFSSGVDRRPSKLTYELQRTLSASTLGKRYDKIGKTLFRYPDTAGIVDVLGWVRVGWVRIDVTGETAKWCRAH